MRAWVPTNVHAQRRAQRPGILAAAASRRNKVYGFKYCCAVGSFFVLFSPVTVTEVWVGRGSVLRARARASKRRQLYANRFSSRQ